jgi:hypothetical protein
MKRCDFSSKRIATKETIYTTASSNLKRTKKSIFRTSKKILKRPNRTKERL